jgi:hypothetical protein
VESGIAAGPSPLHQEDAIGIAQNQVRDDLLDGSVGLGRRPRVEGAAIQARQDLADLRGSHAAPGRTGHEHVTRHGIDELRPRAHLCS